MTFRTRSRSVLSVVPWIVSVAALATLLCPVTACADRLEMADGTIVEGCYARDEGACYKVWDTLEQVGEPPRRVPRSEVAKFTLERAEEWDRRPDLPDLTVTFIEITPKLPGLHGVVDYDRWGRPRLKGGPLPDLGEDSYLFPEKMVKDLKLQYEPGDRLTLTAHVKNLGFAEAEPFDVVWRVGDRVLAREQCDARLGEMDETTFELAYTWPETPELMRFEVVTDQAEIAVMNNVIDDPLWGFAFYYVVNPGRVASWHQFRSAYGTFSWEDFYRWHLDIMNDLFAASTYPSAPDAIRARVRLDRIVYADDVRKEVAALRAEDGLGYHQGGWTWNDSPKEAETGEFSQTDWKWRNSTEWSLPHELGHQLGLIDWYQLDCAGYETHVWPDNGEKVTHFMNHPRQMMHWHGPVPFGEVDAGYLNRTWNMPRGHYGDMVFDIPRECFLRIVDVNGNGIEGAQVEIFQRGAEVDPDGDPGEDQGVRYWPLIENGDFNRPMSVHPVIEGTTGADGVLRLPNRPVKEVRTLNGYHRRPNPFGNMNVVGGRGLMFARVTRDDRPAWFSIELHDFNVAWLRGQRDSWTQVLRAPFGSVGSPPPPAKVAAARAGEDGVKVTWAAPDQREVHYLDRIIGYRVYRRISGDALNDAPWMPVATLGPDKFETVVEPGERVDEIAWFSKTERYAVTSVGVRSLESGLAEVVLDD